MPIAPSDAKHPLASKTLWLNVIGSAIAIVGVIAGQDWVHSNPMLACTAVLILCVLNGLLRFITDAPISWSAGVKLLLIAAVLALGVASPTIAEDTAVLVDTSQPRTYLLVIDAGGNVTVSPLRAVVRPGPSPTPTPPSPLTDRAKAIMAAAKKVSGDPDAVNTAKGMAEILRRVGAIAPQASSAAALETALKMGLDSFLQSRGPAAPAAWQPVRDLLGVQLTPLDFNHATLSEYATLFAEAASGLDASLPADELAGINPQMLQFILQYILPIILALLKIPVPPLPPIPIPM